jgi:hypothetical protein
MSEFGIFIVQEVCFGVSNEHFVVSKREADYLLKSERTGRSHSVSKTKMNSLKSYLETKIGKKGSGGCT